MCHPWEVLLGLVAGLGWCVTDAVLNLLEGAASSPGSAAEAAGSQIAERLLAAAAQAVSSWLHMCPCHLTHMLHLACLGCVLAELEKQQTPMEEK